MATTYVYTGQNNRPNIIRIQAGINNSTTLTDKDVSGILWDEENTEIEVTFVNALSNENKAVLDEIVDDNKDLSLVLDSPEFKLVKNPFHREHTYALFKSIINAKGLLWQYSEDSTKYDIFAIEGSVTHTVIVHKTGDATNLSDFETNYKAGCNRKMGMALDPLPSATISAKHDGIYAVCTKETTTNVDYLMPGNRYLSGANWCIQDSVMGDYFSFKVIDISGILGYGANFVLSTWVDKWYVASDNWIFHQSQTSGLVYGGLYLRAEFHSTGTVLDPKIFINYHLSLKL